jgi:hypothetical protein
LVDYFVDESEDGFGRVFVPRGPWRPAYLELVKERQVEGVRLSAAMGWSGTGVEFLGALPHLKGVEIYSPEVHDASVIGSLSQLQLVGLDCNLRAPIDFRRLSQLEVLKARWTEAIKSVLENDRLRRLNLSHWPGVDLGAIRLMPRLSRLQLTSATLASLGGIGALKSLEWMDLHRCPKLASLDGVQLCQTLWHLEITRCKAVHEISALGALPELRELHLDDNGEIDSLEPIRGCKFLERVSFLGTTCIRDGRISALEELPALKTLRFTPRAHYDRTRESILGGT